MDQLIYRLFRKGKQGVKGLANVVPPVGGVKFANGAPPCSGDLIRQRAILRNLLLKAFYVFVLLFISFVLVRLCYLDVWNFMEFMRWFVVGNVHCC